MKGGAFDLKAVSVLRVITRETRYLWWNEVPNMKKSSLMENLIFSPCKLKQYVIIQKNHSFFKLYINIKGPLSYFAYHPQKLKIINIWKEVILINWGTLDFA